ncbi:peptidylprolyl isomerase [Rhodobacterales bacterium HKCCE3408]|nr:peptidylprolyl isomerase [Rhodobacterales bacterium HKCCE3408]
MAGKDKKKPNILVWLVLGVLLLSLGGFGITSFSGGSSVVARVGSVDITAEEYFRALQRELRSRSAETGQALRLADLQAQGIDVSVLQGLIGRAALLNEAQEMGLSVGDEEVARQIRAIPDFRGSNGGFNRSAYEDVLAQNGFTPAEFEENVRGDTVRSVLQYAVVSGIDAPDIVAEALTARETERRDATIATITEDDLSEPIPEPTSAELSAFYDENGSDFERPELRRITYAWVAPEAIMDEVEVDEDALRALYEERIDEYVRPERRIVERLVYPSQEEADAARAALDAGESDFDALVDARGVRLDDIDLGDVTREDLSAAAAEAVFADDAGEIVGPVESRFGPALFRINAVLDATEVPFEEAMPELRDELALDRARRVIATEEGPIADELAGGATLEDLANDTMLTLGTIDYGPDTDTDIAGYEEFRAAAEAVAEGDFPEILPLSDGGLFALRLDEIVPPTVPPLEEIETEVAEAWAADALSAALEARAQTLLTEIATQGARLEDLDLTLIQQTGISRQGFMPGLPPTMAPNVFGLDTPGDLMVVPGSRAAYLVRLDQIVPGNRNAPETAGLLDLVDTQVSQSIAQDVFGSFGGAMDAVFGIEINQSVINGVHANFP